MVKKRQLAVQSVLDERQLKDFLAAQCVKPVHAKRIWKHVIAKGAEGGIDDVPGAWFDKSRSRVRKGVTLRRNNGGARVFIGNSVYLDYET